MFIEDLISRDSSLVYIELADKQKLSEKMIMSGKNVDIKDRLVKLYYSDLIFVEKRRSC